MGHPKPPDLLALPAEAPFPIQKQPEPLFKRQFPIGGAFHLLPQPFDHAGQLEGGSFIDQCQWA